MAESEDVCITGNDFHSVQIHLKLDSVLLDFLFSFGVKNVHQILLNKIMLVNVQIELS